MSIVRVRATFVALALATIGVGLVVHFHGAALSSTSRDILGDILWAAVIALLVGAIAPQGSLQTRFGVAITICFAVELSQLFHANALDAARRTTIGQLTLGTGFDPRDLAAYTVGVLIVAIIERMWRKPVGEQVS